MKRCADSAGMGAVFASMPKAWTRCFGVGAPNRAPLILALLAGLAQAAPNVVTITADPGVTVSVAPRATNTAKTILLVLNPQDQVIVNGVQIFPKGGSVGLTWAPPPIVTGYVIRYTPTTMLPDGTCPDCKEVAVAGGDTAATTITGLDAAKTYTFAILSVDSKGNRSEVSTFIAKGGL